MKAWLSDDVETGPVTLPATQLSLVTQSHNNRHITWRHTDVPLGDQPLQVPSVQRGGVQNAVNGGARVGTAIQLGDHHGDLHL